MLHQFPFDTNNTENLTAFTHPQIDNGAKFTAFIRYAQQIQIQEIRERKLIAAVKKLTNLTYFEFRKNDVGDATEVVSKILTLDEAKTLADSFRSLNCFPNKCGYVKTRDQQGYRIIFDAELLEKAYATATKQDKYTFRSR